MLKNISSENSINWRGMKDLFRYASILCDRVVVPVGLAYEGVKLLTGDFGNPHFQPAGAAMSIFIASIACLAEAAQLATGNIRLFSRAQSRLRTLERPQPK